MICTNCKAPVESGLSLNCEYCGSPLAERLGSVSAGGSPHSMMEALDQNLQALEAMPVPGFGSIAYESFYWVLTISTFGLVTKLFKLKSPKTVGTKSFEALKSKVERNLADAEDLLKGDELAKSKLARLREALSKASSSVEQTRKVGFGVRLVAGLFGLVPCFVCCGPYFKMGSSLSQEDIEGTEVAESPDWIRGDWTQGTTSFGTVNITFTAGSVVLTDTNGNSSTSRLEDGIDGGSRYQATIGHSNCVFELAGDTLVASDCPLSNGRYTRGTTPVTPLHEAVHEVFARADSEGRPDPAPEASPPSSQGTSTLPTASAADGVRLAFQVTVDATKADGRAWDALGGMPDIAACVTTSTGRQCLPGPGNTVVSGRPAHCQDSLSCVFEFNLESQVSEVPIELVDVDAGTNDAIGSGICAVREASCKIGQGTILFL